MLTYIMFFKNENNIPYKNESNKIYTINIYKPDNYKLYIKMFNILKKSLPDKKYLYYSKEYIEKIFVMIKNKNTKVSLKELKKYLPKLAINNNDFLNIDNIEYYEIFKALNKKISLYPIMKFFSRDMCVELSNIFIELKSPIIDNIKLGCKSNLYLYYLKNKNKIDNFIKYYNKNSYHCFLDDASNNNLSIILASILYKKINVNSLNKKIKDLYKNQNISNIKKYQYLIDQNWINKFEKVDNFNSIKIDFHSNFLLKILYKILPNYFLYKYNIIDNHLKHFLLENPIQCNMIKTLINYIYIFQKDKNNIPNQEKLNEIIQKLKDSEKKEIDIFMSNHKLNYNKNYKFIKKTIDNNKLSYYSPVSIPNIAGSLMFYILLFSYIV